MKAVCACLEIGSTVGCEVRVSFLGTPYEGFRLNNPDSRNVAYMTIHGVPDDGIETLDAFLNPVRRVLKILKLSAIDCDRDVLLPEFSISRYRGDKNKFIIELIST